MVEGELCFNMLVPVLIQHELGFNIDWFRILISLYWLLYVESTLKMSVLPLKIDERAKANAIQRPRALRDDAKSSNKRLAHGMLWQKQDQLFHS